MSASIEGRIPDKLKSGTNKKRLSNSLKPDKSNQHSFGTEKSSLSICTTAKHKILNPKDRSNFLAHIGIFESKDPLITLYCEKH